MTYRETASEVSASEGEENYLDEDVAENTILREYPSVDIDKLDFRVINKKNIPEDICAICLEGFKIRQHSRMFNCSHIFHKKCVDRWLVKSPRCPTCRICVQPKYIEPLGRNVRVLRPRPG